MDETLRDPLTLLGLTMTIFALIESISFTGWKFWIMLFAEIIFAIMTLWELTFFIYSKFKKSKSE